MIYSTSTQQVHVYYAIHVAAVFLRIKFDSTCSAFGYHCSLRQYDVIPRWRWRLLGTITEFLSPPPPPTPPSIGGSSSILHQSLLDDVIPDRGQAVTSTVSVQWRIQGSHVNIASFTSLSNHLCSTNKILVFSNVMLWLGLSECICLETSEVGKLGLLCSPNLGFSERSVSPT